MLLSLACAAETLFASQTGGAPGQNASILADFKARVGSYENLRRKVMSSLPKVSTEATPQEIERYQQSFQAGIAAARGGAKQGDIFTQSARRLIRALITQTFSREDPAAIRESILEGNPGRVRLLVNGRYPEEVPLSNMPADLLMNLPPLPAGLEYRFVGENLILLDTGANLIVDVMPQALPR